MISLCLDLSIHLIMQRRFREGVALRGVVEEIAGLVLCSVVEVGASRFQIYAALRGTAEFRDVSFPDERRVECKEPRTGKGRRLEKRCHDDQVS